MRLTWAVLALLAGGPSAAAERLEGYFIAFESCEAFQSKNNETNPGEVRTDPFRAYAILAINAPAGDFFQVRMPAAPVTEQRWVHVSCGLHVVSAGTEVAPVPGDRVEPSPGAESSEHVLALSWQPAFCETKPGKAECVELNGGNLPVTEQQLSIHGLWPQPEDLAYCGVPGTVVALDKAARWEELPEVAVDAETRERIEVAMPGTASFLERHEWIKHGTCHGGEGGAGAYFADTLTLVEAINGSEVARFLADNVGASVTTAEIRARFDAAFGEGAGERVQVHCTGDSGRTLIQELRVGLGGVVTPEASVGELMRAAPSVPPGCPQGVVDRAGLQ